MDNTPIAKRTHVLSAFQQTFVLSSPYFDDIDNTWLCILNFLLLLLKGHMRFCPLFFWDVSELDFFSVTRVW